MHCVTRTKGKAGIVKRVSKTTFTQKMVVVCVLGVGRLGGNIVGDLAFNGHTVRAWDNDSNNLDKLHERINFEKKRLKEDKIMTYPEMLVNILGFFYFSDLFF